MKLMMTNFETMLMAKRTRWSASFRYLAVASLSPDEQKKFQKYLISDFLQVEIGFRQVRSDGP